MSDKIITFSVAAYNVEEYISQTLDSFICDKEIMDCFEVIIVNDGSKDDTAVISKKYVEEYPGTFILINKENGGYGSTINTSLNIANGKYFKLVDGDDWVNTKQLKNFINILKDETSDLVLTKYCSYNDSDGSKKIVSNGMKFTEKHIDDVNSYFFSEKLAMHQITYRTALLKEIGMHITENCYYTDFEYNMKPFPYIRSLTAYNLCIYVYRIGREGQSVQQSSWFKNIDQATTVTTNLSSYYEKTKKDIVYPRIRSFMRNSIANSAKNKYVILTSMPDDLNPYVKIKKFDKKLKDSSKEIYEYVPNKASNKWRCIIIFMRMTGFSTFKVINAIIRKIKK